MPEQLEIESNCPREGIVLLTLHGILNAGTSDLLDRTLLKLLNTPCPRIILDMAGIQYVSSSGAGVLVNAFQESKSKGGFMILLRPSRGVCEVLELLHLDEFLPVADDILAALTILES